MKLDKDTIVKHQFWFLLGTYLLVWLIAVLWLKVAASEPIKTAEDNYKKSEQKLKTASTDPINTATFCPPWKKYGETFDSHKRVIWERAWNYQMGMYDWPKEFQSKDMTSFQVELSNDERDQFKNDLYKKEVEDFKAWVPTLLGPIELKDGFDNVFQPQKWSETPTREECWLAQEDFWVKRELFYDIHFAMLGQSYMYPVAIDEKKERMPEGVDYRFRFRNQTWEVTLHIRKKGDELVVGGDSTIKNIHPSHHTLPLISAKGTGLIFTVYQDKTQASLEVQGEPVPFGEAQPFDKEKRDYDAKDKDGKKAPLGSIDWSKGKDETSPIIMSQSFDESTCPIRRIEAIAVGKQSCRTHTMALQPNETLAKLDAPKEDAEANKDATGGPSGGGMAGMAGGPPGKGGMSGGPPPGMGSMSGGAGGKGGPSGTPSMMMPGGMAGMTGGATPTQNLTPNNSIERNRYLQPPKKEEDKDAAEKPSRHLPLAVQLIVDQGHIQDVLMALANSRLRIQITQVDFHHAKDYKPQTESEKKGEGGGRMGPMGMLFAPPDIASMYRGSTMQAPPGAGSGSMRPPGGGSGSMGPPPGMGSGSMRPPPGGGSGSMGPPPGMGSGSMRPPAGMSGSTPPDPRRMYGGNRGMPGMMMPGMMMPGMGGGRPPKMGPMNIVTAGGMERGQLIPRTNGDKKKSGQNQGDQNLVEMTVYGIATLYRCPDKPKTDEQSGQPGQPAQPGTAVPPTQPVAPAPGGAKR